MNISFRILHRPLAPVVGGVVVAGAVLAGASGGSPVGAVGVGWTVGVDAPPTVTGPVVAVGGRVGVLLGRPQAVRVRLVPRTELPASCGAVPEVTGPVEAGRYAVELRPACNGPYRAEVVATGTDLLGRTITSGSPATRDLAIADAGPAPGAPSAASGPDGITLTWPDPSDPDIVGWTVARDGGESRAVTGSTTRVVVPAGAGDHGFRLVVRRWGPEGPGGPEVSSSPSGPTVVHVDAADLAPPDRPGGPSGVGGAGALAGGSGDARAGGAGGSGGTSVLAEPPRRRGGPSRGRSTSGSGRSAAPAPGDPGYRGELPYGDRDGAASADEVEPGGEQVAAGVPSARVSRTSERVAPGLVVPFALAFGLFVAAVWLWSSLRRGRLAAVEDEIDLELSA